MPYEPVDDIPDIERGRLDFRKMNLLMRDVLTTTRMALNHPYNFKKRIPYWEDELRQYLKHQLLIYQTTHDSIHILLNVSLRKDYYPPVVDAASLCREQIEKVFSIAPVLGNPHKWVKQSIRGAWRHDYEMYLLALEEHGLNPRYEPFLSKKFIEHLKTTQRPPWGKYRETMVSDLAKRVLSYYWQHAGAPKKPSWLKRKGSVRDYLSDYFEFPTPGKSIRFIKHKALKRFLWRWHKDYSYYSQFTHVGPEKAVIPVYGQSRHLAIAAKLKVIADKLLNTIVFTSFIATASASTLIVNKLRDSYGAKHYLNEFWQQLLRSSLLARAIWNTYPKKFR